MQDDHPVEGLAHIDFRNLMVLVCANSWDVSSGSHRDFAALTAYCGCGEEAEVQLYTEQLHTRLAIGEFVFARSRRIPGDSCQSS
jgi:hypothetical protein